MNIEHIGIAVHDLSGAVSLYERLLGTPCYKQETVDSEGVATAFFRTGDSKVELLAATREDSPIAKFLENGGKGIHHVAFGVRDIYAEMARLKAAGFVLLNDAPKKGADGKLVCFVHPKTAGGVLVELCMDEVKSIG